MDPDDYIADKPDSAGAHSVRSQLIVVSPRPSTCEELEERERAAGAGSGESQRSSRSSSGSEDFTFANPIATMEPEREGSGAGQLTITMEMSNVSEPRRARSAAAAGDNKTTPPSRRHSHGLQGAAVAPQPQLAATIVSISQSGGTTPPPPSSNTTTTTPPALRPTTVPIFHSRTDKHTTADSASAAATRPKTTGAVNNKKKKDKKRYRALSEVEDLEQQEGDDTSPPLSPIDEQVLEEVLYSRPTLRLGREMSMKFRAQTAAIPSRRRRVYRSLPHRAKRPKTTDAALAASEGGGRHRRTSSLPNVNDEASAITLEDIQNIITEEEPPPSSTLRRQEDLRKSNRRLKERIQMHHQREEVRTRVAQDNCCSNFYYVKWPKIKSGLRVALSYRLWNGHMKEVEGHFGTAVVSYFVYLRWLFIMNLVIFALWFGLIIVPNSIFIAVEDPPRAASLLSCAYPFSDNAFTSCSDDSTPSDSDNLFYLLTSSPMYTCTALSNSTSFSLRTCGTSESFINGTQQNITDRETTTTVTVSDSMPNLADCTFENGNVTIQQVRVCSSGIAPFIPWYQYIIDFALGQGTFNQTVLFYGRYSNATIGNYNLPVAYLFMTGVVYTVSIALLVFKMGQAYNESYVEVGKSKSINFCNKLFTAWDFNITDPDTAKLRRAQIKTDFEEEIADFERRNKKRTWKELAIVIIIRTLTNLFTLLVLVAAAAIIFYSTQFGLQNQSSSSIQFEGLVTPVVITTLNLILPFLFSFLARFERFKTQSGEIKMTLVRTILVRLASLIVLMATIFILIQCTQTVMEDTTSSTTTTCSFSSNLISDNINNLNITSSQDCPICWETFIGQEFYKLGLTNLAVSAASTIAVETFRNFASRVRYKGLGDKIGKGNFNIPKSILDLIYTQSLLWLGFFFSPLVPAVVLLTSFTLFYVKKYSLMYNLEPDKRGATKTARNNFLYLFLMLATLGFFLIPVAVVIGTFRPSETCGPFRGDTSFFVVVSSWVNSFSCVTQQALDFFASAGFVIPVLALLLLVIYGEHVLLRSRKAKFELIKKQLILEGANVTHIVGKLDSVLQKVADHRQEVINTMVVTSPTPNGSNQGQDGGSDPSPQNVTLRKHSSVDGVSIADSVTPLRQRIENMRLSVSSENDPSQSNFNSLNRGERRRKKSPASSSMGESSGEYRSNPAKETTSHL